MVGNGENQRTSSTTQVVPTLAKEMNFSLSAATIGTNTHNNSFVKNLVNIRI